jgi:hypothetical protein
MVVVNCGGKNKYIVANCGRKKIVANCGRKKIV